MSKSQTSFNKKEREKLKAKKRKEKAEKKQAKKEGKKETTFEDMIAYVDQNGNIVSDQPDLSNKEKIDPESIEISVAKKEDVPEEPTSGTLVYYNDDKGYGFIQDAVTKNKVFVHRNQMLEEIREGNQVFYDVEKGLKGLVAVNVKLKKS